MRAVREVDPSPPTSLVSSTGPAPFYSTRISVVAPVLPSSGFWRGAKPMCSSPTPGFLAIPYTPAYTVATDSNGSRRWLSNYAVPKSRCVFHSPKRI